MMHGKGELWGKEGGKVDLGFVFALLQISKSMVLFEVLQVRIGKEWSYLEERPLNH